MTPGTLAARRPVSPRPQPDTSLLSPRLLKLAAWLLGFVILFNPYLIPGLETAPRATDAIGLGLWGLLAGRLLTGRTVNIRVLGRLLIALFLILIWMMRDVVRLGVNPEVGHIRWILAIGYGYFLWHLAQNRETRFALALGLVWGAVANLGVVVLQWFDHADLVVSLGLASPRFETRWATVGGEAEVRPFGMWGHPNAASGVIAIGFPVILGLIDEGRLKTKWLLAGLGISFMTSAITLTRSGMIIAGMLFPVWALGVQQSSKQRAMRLFIILVLMGIAGLIGPPGGWDRWTDKRTGENRGERIQATVVALELAVERPLGMGAEYKEALIKATGGIPATHNAWMYLAMVAGIPLTLLLMMGVIKHALTLTARRSIEGWLAFAFLGLFFFEEYFRVPVFPPLTMWLLATPIGLLESLRMVRPHPARAPAVAR